MTAKLHIADDFALPTDFATQSVAILAKRGAGKSYTASVLGEELLKAGQPIVAVDPTGAWWGLRSGFPVVILGGEHADVPLEESSGEVVAKAIVENRFPAVLDLSLFRKGQMFRFMVSFAETLYRLNREALHLFVDEADQFAPQARNYGGDENRLLGAMEDIVRRGRKRGIGCTLITQRPAVLNKNVLTQCEVLIALRMVHPKDIDAIKEWVNVHGDPDTSKQMIESLPSLPVGTAWFWSPGWGDIFQRVKVRHRETFDSGATPKPGEAAKRPKSLKPIDVDALGEQIKATVEKAKADDPRELRRRIAELERAARTVKPPSPAKADEREVQTLKHALRETMKVLKAAADAPLSTGVNRDDVEAAVRTFTDRIIGLVEKSGRGQTAAIGRFNVEAAKAIDRLQGLLNEAPAVASNGQAAPPPAAVQRPATRPDDAPPAEGLKRTEQAVLDAAATLKGGTKKRIAIYSGRSIKSSSFDQAFPSLVRNGLLVKNGETYEPTQDGMRLARPMQAATLNEWLAKVKPSEAKVLKAIADAYPNERTKVEVAAETGQSEKSSSFDQAFPALRALGLIVGTNHFKLAEEWAA